MLRLITRDGFNSAFTTTDLRGFAATPDRLDFTPGSARRPWNDTVVGLGCCLVAVAEKVGAAKTAEEEAAAAIGGDNVVGEIWSG